MLRVKLCFVARRVRKKRASDSDEDCPSSDLILTGKRKRYAVKRDNRDDTESDLEEEDPYATDESDEWIPNTEDAESQYTQNTFDD